jgi:predicted Zn-dependent protease
MAYGRSTRTAPPLLRIAIALIPWLWLSWFVLPGQASAAGFTLMSEAGEIETGRKLDEEIGQKLGFYTDAKLQAYVSEIGQRLVRAGSPRSFEYSFKIVDMAEENAFATVGGFVYITRGMLASLNNETELAGVLAHEIGHISHRHAAKQQTRALGYQLLGLGAAAVGATMGNANNNLGMAPLGVSAALMTIMRGYDQQAELEADESGLLTMTDAGYDPRGLVGFLRSLRIQERLTGVGYHALLATHPETAERIAKADIMAQLLASEKSFGDPSEDTYKAHLEGLPYGNRQERLRLTLYQVQSGDTPASLRQKFMTEGERRWDIARLNRLRSNDALRPGMLLKVVMADDRSQPLPRRRLDLSEERPMPSSPPSPSPTRRSRVPRPGE